MGLSGEFAAQALATAVMRQLPTGVLVIADAGQVVFANPRAEALLGASLVGQAAAVAFLSLAELKASADSGEETRHERRWRVAGIDRELGFSVVRLDAPEVQGFAVVLKDITDLQKLKLERDRLVQLAAVGEVLPALLHEIKNPLAAVRAALEVLIEDHANQPLAQELHAILNEVRRVGLTLDGVGRLKHDLRTERPAAIDQACRDAFTVLTSMGQAKGVTMTPRIASLPLLSFDPGAFRAIVFNLVMNSLHACKPGDTIELTVALVAGELVLAVKDSGHGMSDEVQQRSRELFFTTKMKGSGIGLTLVQSLVDSAHGRLHIVSGAEIGTAITLHIPVEAPA